VPRRSNEEIAADLQARASKLRAESDRRLACASDPFCELLYTAEKAVRAVIAYGGEEAKAEHEEYAEMFKAQREARWARLKEEEKRP
jgi:hypothetical protein